jgi:hypothetical protein
MSVTHLLQPSDLPVCGQTCVAMAAGVSLERAYEVFGHQSGTTTREVVQALRHLGINCADRLRRCSKTRAIPARAILHTREQGGRRAHWMLMWDGRVYDPADRYPDDHWPIVSYLEIFS